MQPSLFADSRQGIYRDESESSSASSFYMNISRAPIVLQKLPQ